MKHVVLTALLALPVLACGNAAEEPATPPADQDAPKAQTVALEEAEREVRCGCKIDGIGHCGNYVADGDDWLEISNREELGLGVMEWCKLPKDMHAMAVTAGERSGDQATLSKLVPK